MCMHDESRWSQRVVKGEDKSEKWKSHNDDDDESMSLARFAWEKNVWQFFHPLFDFDAAPLCSSWVKWLDGIFRLVHSFFIGSHHHRCRLGVKSRDNGRQCLRCLLNDSSLSIYSNCSGIRQLNFALNNFQFDIIGMNCLFETLCKRCSWATMTKQPWGEENCVLCFSQKLRCKQNGKICLDGFVWRNFFYVFRL